MDERRDLGREEFTTSFVRKSRPVVLRADPVVLELARTLPLDRLEAVLGDTIVPVKVSSTRVFHAQYDAVCVREMPLRDLLEYIRSEPAHEEWLYLQEVAIGAFPAVAGAFVLPPVLERIEEADVRIWIGPGGCATVLHYDRADNLLMQLHGTKRVTLFDPYQSRHLYPHPASSECAHVSQVAFEGGVDLARFPRFARAKGSQTTLEPGDALFIPAYHWHFVQSVSATVSVNVWW